MSEPAKVKENSDVRKEGKEGAEGKAPKKRTAFSRMKGLVATLAVATTFGLATEACSGSDENPPPLPPDGSVVDGGETDADSDTDSGGPDTDAGPDTDSGIVDGGETDSGPDVDAGDTDSSTLMCSSAVDDEVSDQLFEKNVPVEVGGYFLTYIAPTSNGATFQITCASDETQTDTQNFSAGSEGTYVADDKTIRITVHSSNTWDVTASVTVE